MALYKLIKGLLIIKNRNVSTIITCIKRYLLKNNFSYSCLHVKTGSFLYLILALGIETSRWYARQRRILDFFSGMNGWCAYSLLYQSKSVIHFREIQNIFLRKAVQQTVKCTSKPFHIVKYFCPLIGLFRYSSIDV